MVTVGAAWVYSLRSTTAYILSHFVLLLHLEAAEALRLGQWHVCHESIWFQNETVHIDAPGLLKSVVT